MFAPDRRDATASLKRGVVEAKRGVVRLSEAHWNPRCCFSAARVKAARVFLYETQKRVLASVVQLACDEMKKTPIWINASARGKLGYIKVDEKGHAHIPNWDHSFPLTSSYLISLHGVVRCGREPDPGSSASWRPHCAPARSTLSSAATSITEVAPRPSRAT